MGWASHCHAPKELAQAKQKLQDVQLILQRGLHKVTSKQGHPRLVQGVVETVVRAQALVQQALEVLE